MIRITKPSQAPKILRERGRTTTDDNCATFDVAPNDYLAGNKTFEFDRSLYAAKSVKKALVKAQHEKCCFCESKVTDVAYGDVEHFRPKAGYRQTGTDPLGRPGYYWLAYVWENLFFSCQLCNQRFKASRATFSHWMTLRDVPGHTMTTCRWKTRCSSIPAKKAQRITFRFARSIRTR